MDGHLDADVKCLGEPRRRHDLIGRADRDDPACPEQQHARREVRGGFELVHRGDARDSLSPDDAYEQIVELEAMPHVEERGGLVEEQHARPLREGARQGDTPPLTAAQLVDAALGEIRQVAPGDRILDDVAILGALLQPRALVRRSAHGDDVAHPEAERHALALRQERDHAGELASAGVAHLSARHPHLPLARLEQPGSEPQERRLASAVRAENRRDLAGVDVEAHLLERERRIRAWPREPAPPHRVVSRRHAVDAQEAVAGRPVGPVLLVVVLGVDVGGGPCPGGVVGSGLDAPEGWSRCFCHV